MRVSFKEMPDLRGEIQRVVHRVGDGSIIKLFDKTPPPRKPTDVICPHFLELKWANGCYFDCAWCYLNGTYRFHTDWKNGKPNIKNFGEIELHLRTLLSNNGFQPEILNAGELSDSLISERGSGERLPFSEFITNVMSKYDHEGKHRVLFLTKSTEIQNLLKLAEKASRRIIVSFTLNAKTVSKRWEKRAPPIKERIVAARKVSEAGYTTRIRLDPIVPVESWQEHYIELVDEIFSNLRPERITLGSLRGLPSTIANTRDKSWIQYMTEKSNWGRKIDFKTRYEAYASIMKYMRTEYKFKQLALCKETIEMWAKLGLDYRQIKCNCIA